MLNIFKKIYKPKNIVLLSVVLITIMFLQFISFQSPDLSNNIDGSWPYTLSTLRSTPQDLGENIHYTYGPYFEKLPTFPSSDDGIFEFLTGIAFATLLLSGISFVTYVFSKHITNDFSETKPATGFLVLLFFIALLPATIDTLFYMLLLFCAIAIRADKGSTGKIWLIISLLPISLYKVSFTIAFLLIILLSLIPTDFKVKSLLSSLYNYLTVLVASMLFFCVLSQSPPSAFVKYLYYGFANSAAYSEFMGLGYSTNFGIVISFTLLFYLSLSLTILAILYLTVRSKLRYPDEYSVLSLIFFSIVYFAFKQSVTRSDGPHLLTFLPFIPLILMSVVSTATKIWPIKLLSKISITNIVLITGAVSLIINLVALNVLFDNNSPKNYIISQVKKLTSGVVNNPLNYRSFLAKQAYTEKQVSNISKKSAGLNTFLEKNYDTEKGVVFFGNTTVLGDTLDTDREVVQLPFLQNYAAFPPQIFDDVYISFIRKHSEKLIYLDETEPSINERITSHELSGFFEYIKANYNIAYSDPRHKQYLLEPKSHNMEICTAILSMRVINGEEFAVPKGDINTKNSYIKMRVDFEPKPDVILSLLIKPPLYALDLRSKDGGFLPRRTTVSTLEHGVSVYPFYISYTDVALGTPVDISTLAIRGGVIKGAEMSVNFEECRF